MLHWGGLSCSCKHLALALALILMALLTSLQIKVSIKHYYPLVLNIPCVTYFLTSIITDWPAIRKVVICFTLIVHGSRNELSASSLISYSLKLWITFLNYPVDGHLCKKIWICIFSLFCVVFHHDFIIYIYIYIYIYIDSFVSQLQTQQLMTLKV